MKNDVFIENFSFTWYFISSFDRPENQIPYYLYDQGYQYEDYNYYHYPSQSYLDYHNQYQIDPNNPYNVALTDICGHDLHHHHHYHSLPPQTGQKTLLNCDTCDKKFNYPYTLNRHKKKKDHDNIKGKDINLTPKIFKLWGKLNL